MGRRQGMEEKKDDYTIHCKRTVLGMYDGLIFVNLNLKYHPL
jgi:hypothetical protein